MPEWYPVDFSVAAVGAHASVSTDLLASVQTLTKPGTATAILIQNTGTFPVRFTIDESDPTSTRGFRLLNDSMEPCVIPCPGDSIKVIQEAVGAVINYQWIR